jgi:hypothetical protein
MPMTAAVIAKDDLLKYCSEKTSGWLDDEAWKLYQFLLKQAKAYQQDMSGYLSLVYQDDQKRAKKLAGGI